MKRILTHSDLSLISTNTVSLADISCGIKNPMHFLEFPDELILIIFQYLDFKDLQRQTCLKFNQIGKSNVFWKHFTYIYWLKKRCPKNITSKMYFYQLYRKWGKYIDYYKDIKKAWEKIDSYTKCNVPEIYNSLKAGLTESELEKIENAIGYKFPLDFRCSYRIRNGQKLNAPGVLGSMEIGTHYTSEALLDLETLVQPIIWARASLRGCLPVTVCVNTGVSQYLALSGQDGHRPGTMFYPVNDRRLANSGGAKDCFITGRSFTEWLTNYAESLSLFSFPLIKNEIYRFTRVTSNVATSNHITVTADTSFRPELSSVNPPRFFHTYRITMHMNKNVNPSHSCQLATRHWLITDALGNEERVNGPGVVGEYPIISPGITYSWISCTTFNTDIGYMEGHFTMYKRSTGESIDVMCPRFRMECLPYETAELRKSRVNLKNILTAP